MEITQEQQLYAEVVQKAWEDEAFKTELIANPVEAIEKATGLKLQIPEGKTLIVRDQTAEDTVYINIPAQQETAYVELDEAQLEAVTGGKGGGILGNLITPIFPGGIISGGKGGDYHTQPAPIKGSGHSLQPGVGADFDV